MTTMEGRRISLILNDLFFPGKIDWPSSSIKLLVHYCTLEKYNGVFNFSFQCVENVLDVVPYYV